MSASAISTAAPADALLAVQRLSKRFGGFVALREVDVAVAPGERLGLIGPNGSGKTTLINCVSGVLRPDGGRILLRGRDIGGLAAHARTRLGVARSFQIPLPFASMSVAENLRVPLEYVAHRGAGFGIRHDGDAMRAEALAILARFGLQAKAEARAGDLSQIELRKLELARAVAARPTLLVSDEAMAGLSNAEIDEVMEILLRLNAEDGTAIIMIEHMMRAIMRFSQRVVCLDAGRLIANGPPNAVVADPAVRKVYLGA